jgi:hypothetical protein
VTGHVSADSGDSPRTNQWCQIRHDFIYRIVAILLTPSSFAILRSSDLFLLGINQHVVYLTEGTFVTDYETDIRVLQLSFISVSHYMF